MILVRAPLRLSFFGGGSDIPSHFLQYGGATLSATFDKFVYAAITPTPQAHIKVTYSTTEYATSVSDVRHDIVREGLRYYHIDNHLEVSSFADIPTVGTGLGASSAFNVALVAGLERLRPTADTLTPSQLVSVAAHIELNRVGSPIGYQDHIAAAHGGMIFTKYFSGDDSSTAPFDIEPLPVFPELFDCLFLVKMPVRRVSANVILQQGMKPSNVSRLVHMAYQGKLLCKQKDIRGFGELLHQSWEEKKQAHPDITTDDIDAAYNRARNAGVLGGKLLGAGSGGYLLLCAANVESKQHIQNTAFHDMEWYNVKPVSSGVKVVYDDTNNR